MQFCYFHSYDTGWSENYYDSLIHVALLTWLININNNKVLLTVSKCLFVDYLFYEHSRPALKAIQPRTQWSFCRGYSSRSLSLTIHLHLMQNIMKMIRDMPSLQRVSSCPEQGYLHLLIRSIHFNIMKGTDHCSARCWLHIRLGGELW
jgi:hypothetical protein